MVRATATAVSKVWGYSGTVFPPGWTATTVGYICDAVDDELDEYELSSSDAGAVALANQLVYRRMIHVNWAQAGGPMSGTPEPVVWSKDLIDWRDRLDEHGTYEFVAVVDTVNDGDR